MTQESEKKALRDWYKLESEHVCYRVAMILADAVMLTDTREQPAEPANTSLHDLLELVEAGLAFEGLSGLGRR